MKKLCILSLPRSGSNLLLRIIWPSLKAYHEYTDCLNEIQNAKNQIFDTGSRLMRTDHNRKKEWYIEGVFDKRVDGLKRYNHQKYFFKMFPWKSNHWSYFFDNYDFVLLERKDKREQYLSFILAMEANIWESTRAVNYVRKMALFKQSHMKTFEDSEREYKKVKKQLFDVSSDQKILFYEDFCDLENPFEILDKLGIKQVPNLNPNIWLPTKIPYEGKKSDFIENIDEFDEWFENFKKEIL